MKRSASTAGPLAKVSVGLLLGIAVGLAVPGMAWILLRHHLLAPTSLPVVDPASPFLSTTEQTAESVPMDPPAPPARKPIPAPELEGGVAWLNTAGPLSLKKDLKGKIVLLDFWTLCCINCMHILPDLAKLEKKYANQLVVIGVHSPKFENEKDTNSIRQAILRYQIEHPVVNDAEHKIWNAYDVDAWPTFVLIDPEGNLVGYTSGEGRYELLDKVIEKLIEQHREKKTLDERPIRFDLVKYRQGGDTPLFFPGKVLADAASKRLFIADSTHHRLVVTDLEGNHIYTIGTGEPGAADGPFDKCQFQDPQGLALGDDILYVADRKNHLIRAVDLSTKTVRTIAGTGEQDGGFTNRQLDKPVPARSIGLNSPWDLCLVGDTLYIAMAGHHQIWAYDLKKRDIGPYAGTGRENIRDGPLRFADFAQPSGLTTDGRFLYVADCETSSLRKVPLGGDGRVETLVGRGLFVFGDVDGPGRAPPEAGPTEARLQHAIGVVHHDGKLYVADTYNNKIKIFDLSTGRLETFVGHESDWPLLPHRFHEPAGLSYALGKLYVADTNAHRIQVVDLATRRVSTLPLRGVQPPAPSKP
ncbi:MAG: thioredoxin-like domain-containing protein [Gemmataceae bacterium]|nr:thioredoxin-like domain-containing protein [Gemmataceae bacterium]MDW8242072.1 thioredoxin-like domain-containing protein [Thermogemmata sp.]